MLSAYPTTLSIILIRIKSSVTEWVDILTSSGYDDEVYDGYTFTFTYNRQWSLIGSVLTQYPGVD